MTTRSTVRTVTFRHSFRLPGMEKAHAPGSFQVNAEEEQFDLMWDAYRTSMSIMLPYPGRVEALPVTQADLDAAIARDQQSSTGTDFS
ncbi:hypothetical protein [Devosia sp. RR2S18]|uniref:hypothetical protein n=1 Tax=Devosia rhizosphaerae TaxID=3049774 RepID=UPI0025411D0C|nr:hypothetical protein [Devosia sp. RR2S18]WIJ25167.1 hypothetical protein QOV41_19515 [Devosia sp. RR2S18]